MIRFTSILVLNLLCGNISAQQIYFSNNQEPFTCTNFTGAIVQTIDSGYVYVSSNYTQPNLGYTFIRLNKFGDTIFTRSYFYPDRSFSIGQTTRAALVDNDGNYLFAGYAVDTNNNVDGYLIKFDPFGDTLWTMCFADFGSEYLTCISNDAANNYWLCGSTTSQGNGLSDFWLIKLDSNFSYLWDSVYGTTQSEGIVCAELTMDGGIAMSGRSGNVPYVVLVDSTGAPVWQFAYSSFDGYGYISQMPDSGFIVACGKILTSTDDDGCLFKLAPDGLLQWSKYVGFANRKEGLSAKPLIVGSEIIVAGGSRQSAGYYEGYLAKTDLNGNLIWHRRYIKNAMGHHYIYDLEETSDHGFVMAGSCNIATQDAWLLKVDSLGCDSANCDGVGIREPIANNTISLYPNPATVFVTVSFSGLALEKTGIEVYSFDGRLIDNAVTNSNTVQLNTAKYPAGIYFVRAIQNGECRAMEKLIIAR